MKFKFTLKRFLFFVASLSVFYSSISFLMEYESFLWWNWLNDIVDNQLFFIPHLYSFSTLVVFLSSFVFFNKNNQLLKVFLFLAFIISFSFVFLHIAYWIMYDYYMGFEMLSYEILSIIHLVYLIFLFGDLRQRFFNRTVLILMTKITISDSYK